MRTIAHEGHTILFSSHLLDEVEQVADHVTTIDEGRIVLSRPLAELRQAHHGRGVAHQIGLARGLIGGGSTVRVAPG